MRKLATALAVSLLIVTMLFAGCDNNSEPQKSENMSDTENDVTATKSVKIIKPTTEIIELKSGFSTVSYEGDYGFDEYLEQGGASTDAEIIEFLTDNLLSGMDLGFLSDIFGCSTISVKSPEGDTLFGRNFDWENCEAMVVSAHPNNGYASISTVNMDFIQQGAGGGVAGLALHTDQVRTIAALYAPLDGMNEKGFVVSVNMIQDSTTINQNTEKPDITTTTVIRLLLDKAANVEEALTLLSQYDMHGSMGMMVHFALADVSGRSVVVEYVNNEMIVSETQVVTNFYLANGEKKGIGTTQSHERYDILMKQLSESETMSTDDVKETLNSVSKGNFGEFESTEWSIVFNQSTREASYYHRENYENSYLFTVKEAL